MVRSSNTMLQSEALTQSFVIFRGQVSDVSKVKDPKLDDICLDEWNQIFVYTGLDGGWSEISSDGDKPRRRKVVSICSRCGGALPISDRAIDSGYIKCPFCGVTTIFEYEEDANEGYY